MLATRVTAICIALGLHLLATANPTERHEDGQGYGQHVREKHDNGIRGKGDKEARESVTDTHHAREHEHENGQKHKHGHKHDGEHEHAHGIGGKGDKEARESVTGTPHHAHEHEHENEQKHKHEHKHDGEHEHTHGIGGKGDKEARESVTGTPHHAHEHEHENEQKHKHEHKHDGEHEHKDVSGRGVSGRGEKEEFAEKGEDGPSSPSLFIGASIAGGVLAALTMAAYWRWRTSFRCNSSNQKNAQLDAATTIVVGCTSPNASDKKTGKIADPFQAGQMIVVGVPIQSNADLELGTGKPTQK